MKTLNKPIIAIVAIVIFGIGFVSGMEYKAYQIRNAIGKALSGANSSNPSPTSASAIEEAKKEATIIVNKIIGEEVALVTGNITVNSSEEKQTISSSYSSPKVAKEGTKFIVVNLDVVNTTKSEFSFSPNDVFTLQDNQQREYKTYSDSIGSIENYLNYKTLTPSVKVNGFLVYEIPVDSANYSLVTSKAGTKELYFIKLQ